MVIEIKLDEQGTYYKLLNTRTGKISHIKKDQFGKDVFITEDAAWVASDKE